MVRFTKHRDDADVRELFNETSKRRNSEDKTGQKIDINIVKPEPLLQVFGSPNIKKSHQLLFSSIRPDKQQIETISKNYDPSKTGALLMRMDLNKIRTTSIAAADNPVTRKFQESSAKPLRIQQKNFTKDDQKRDNLQFNFMMDHDLEDFYTKADPLHRPLPAVQQTEDILSKIKAPPD